MDKKIVTRAILLDDENKVLLGKRIRGGGVGKWALIGGKLDEGETPEQAIVREVKEELGVDFEPTFFKKFEDQISSDRANDEQTPWDVYVYFGHFHGTPILQPEEVEEIILLTKDNYEDFDIGFNHKEILQAFFSENNS